MMKQLLGKLVVLVVLTSGTWAADSGADLYKAKCANCHGVSGAADTAMGKKLEMKPVKDPAVAKLTEKDFTDITVNGKAKMPAYKGTLTNDQVKAVVSYMRGLK